MNGYKLQAESYQKVLDRDRSTMDPESIANMERDIHIFNILAEFEPGDKYKAFDSSMYNDIFKGYIKKIIDELCEDADADISNAAITIRSKVNSKASAILDRINAKEAESYYMTH